MNIFLLDDDIQKCAEYHCDKHIVKMPIEYAQLISAVLVPYGLEAPYKETHKNHPCAVWARAHADNYTWLYDLAIATGAEYTYRYGKIHKSTAVLDTVPRVISGMPAGSSPPPNCTTIKTGYSLVDSYRLYYMRDKARMLTFKNRPEPPWMHDRYYLEQLDILGPLVIEVKPPRVTKADLLEKCKIKGVSKLLLKDIQKLLLITEFPELVLPDSRLKAPYIAELQKIASSVDWSKLTIKEMSEVITSLH